ncbi:SLAM family member 8-like isoform X2 [Polyodon spathula]|uniref:SLAM family member 8-like isoform X2 n=1 Tax=Polyodon spathula TaxID=7913 RepID=UPI001B7ED978|nr:SLAM family member 8-like isoform X2 [Polyodon spathula]
MPRIISCWTVLVTIVISGLPKRITWSIFNNDTLIATLISGSTNVALRPKFKDRLHLNRTHGSLLLTKLQMEDAMSYTVNIISSTEQCNEAVNLQITAPVEIEKTEPSGVCPFTLKCFVSNYSNLSYIWKFNIYKERGPILSVRDIPFNTEESYTCVAFNNETSSSATVTEHCDNAGNVNGNSRLYYISIFGLLLYFGSF